jgi:hypothetical protein
MPAPVVVYVVAGVCTVGAVIAFHEVRSSLSFIAPSDD